MNYLVPYIIPGVLAAIAYAMVAAASASEAACLWVRANPEAIVIGYPVVAA
jgi:hypothetical protein